MEMFLAVAAISLMGVAVSAALFAAATRGEQSPPVVQPTTSVTLPTPHFFADPLAAETRVPIEALLLQIEKHVRLELIAAESFVDLPSRELLHSRTASPLVH